MKKKLIQIMIFFFVIKLPLVSISLPVPLLINELNLEGKERDYQFNALTKSTENLLFEKDQHQYLSLGPHQSSLHRLGPYMSESTIIQNTPPAYELWFSSLIGGSGTEWLSKTVVDDYGNIYVGGRTTSEDFPVKNAYNATFGGANDIFIMKLSSDGKEILFSTFLGGSENDFLGDMEIDQYGNILFVGTSYSSNFPVKNAYQSSLNGPSDGIIGKLSADGQTILFSSYFGGSVDDAIHSIISDATSAIYFVGETISYDFPMINSLNGTFGGASDIFLTKMTADGQVILYSTFIGGSNYDLAKSLIFDNSGNIILVGETYSTDFPLKNPLQSLLAGNSDGYLTKILANGQTILYSTYIGGSEDDDMGSVTLNNDNSLFLTGSTKSPDFPLMNAIDGIYQGINEGFFMKLSADGQTLLLSSFLGGSKQDWLTKLFITPSNHMILIGSTESANFPFMNSSELSYSGSFDSFFLKLFPENQTVEYSTFFGGSQLDTTGGFVDQNGNVFLYGTTFSSDFPTTNGLNSTFKGVTDIFITKYLPYDSEADGMRDSWELTYGLVQGVDDSQTDLDNDGMPNLWEYQMGLIPTIDDSGQDQDNDGMPNLWEYQMGLLGNVDDAEDDLDNDGMPNLWEYQMGLIPTIDDSGQDQDNDGMLNLWEYQMGLLGNVDDASGDADTDGMPNLWEYQMGLLANVNDASGDADNDGMPNLWEYQMGLNASFNDAFWDKDSDWVTNKMEYDSGTNSSDFWSFPLFYSDFPFFLSAPLVVLGLGGVTTIGLTIACLVTLIRFQRKRFTQKFGAPDYATAKLMAKGGFTDYETFHQAQLLDINSLEEYEFTLEVQQAVEDTENN